MYSWTLTSFTPLQFCLYSHIPKRLQNRVNITFFRRVEANAQQVRSARHAQEEERKKNKIVIITFFPHSLPRPLHSPIVCLRLPGEGFHTSKGPIAGGKRRNLLSVGKTKASTSTIRSKISKDSIRTQSINKWTVCSAGNANDQVTNDFNWLCF